MLLVVNAGSSSLKLALFDRGLRQVAQARAERIGTEGHGAALREGLAEMGIGALDLRAAAHRVVHGGAGLTAPCRLTGEVLAGMRTARAAAQSGQSVGDARAGRAGAGSGPICQF